MSTTEVTEVNTTYHGWSNRETWVINLWITSEEYLYFEMRYLLKFYRDSGQQAKALEDWVCDELDEHTSAVEMWHDLLASSLSRVNWYEIAKYNQ